MHIVRFAKAPTYQAPGHTLMSMVRLQGREAGPTDTTWLGVSTIAPGAARRCPLPTSKKSMSCSTARSPFRTGKTKSACSAGTPFASRAARIAS